MMIRFLRGSKRKFPWELERPAWDPIPCVDPNCYIKRKEQALDKIKFAQEILRVKKETPIESLCEGLHPIIYEYMCYVRSMKYEEAPNYKVISKLFARFQKGKVALDFDWVTFKSKSIEERQMKKVIDSFGKSLKGHMEQTAKAFRKKILERVDKERKISAAALKEQEDRKKKTTTFSFTLSGEKTEQGGFWKQHDGHLSKEPTEHDLERESIRMDVKKKIEAIMEEELESAQRVMDDDIV